MAAHLLGDLCRQHHGRRRRGLKEGVVVGQLEHLLIGGVGQFLAAIADIDAPEPSHPIEDLGIVAIEDVAAVGTRDDAAAAQGLLQAIVALRRKVVGQIQATKLGNIVVTDRNGHRATPDKGGDWRLGSPRKASPNIAKNC